MSHKMMWDVPQISLDLISAVIVVGVIGMIDMNAAHKYWLLISFYTIGEEFLDTSPATTW